MASGSGLLQVVPIRSDLTRTRKIRKRSISEALILRRVNVGDADLMVTLWTKQEGPLSVMASSARRAKSKFSALEPLHTLRVVYDVGLDAPTGRLVEAELIRPRLGITRDLGALEAASTLLAWLRNGLSERVAEPGFFERVEGALDRFDARAQAAEVELARVGFSLLRILGYALDFEACAVCGRACPPERSATIEPARGGLLCAACGGGPILVRAAERQELVALALDREATEAAESPAMSRLALRVVQQALVAHGIMPDPKRASASKSGA